MPPERRPSCGANTMDMTRKFDPNLGQYRDSGKFDGNDNQPAIGGMNALGGPAAAESTMAVNVRSGTKHWEISAGKLHRLDGPAKEYANGSKEYWVNGELHRTDGPARDFVDGSKEYWVNGELHRTDGPAVEAASGAKGWYQDGVPHNLSGPASIDSKGRKAYFVAGKKLSEEEFNTFFSGSAAPHHNVPGLEMSGYRGENDGAYVYQLDAEDGVHVRINLNDSTAVDIVVGEHEKEATSNWECSQCEGQSASMTFSDIADVGLPICGECGDDMKLLN